MNPHIKVRSFILTSLITLTVFLSACTGATPQDADTTSLQPTSPPPTISPSETPLPTPTQSPLTIWFSSDLPAGFLNATHLPAEWVISNTKETADLIIQQGSENPVGYWVYALVAPFPTIIDNISSEDFLSIWQGTTSDTEPHQIFITQSDLNLLQAQLGTASSNVQIMPEESILDTAWQDQNSWAVIPFERLSPQWKVIQIDGLNPIHKEFQTEGYTLTLPISAIGQSERSAEMLTSLAGNSDILLSGNRDPQHLTTVILTGVTALVRATAATMEYRGMTYPGEDIRDWLREADFTHINNEVPFAKNCPTPRGEQENLVFCSKPEYIELLEDIGTDIVDLSGDHFADWGDDAILYTLDLYRQENWMIFGGGENLEEGRKPLKIEHNGNKIAFLGCNAKDPGYAQASATKPGAVHCDKEYLYAQIQSLKAEGYLPIVTMQHIEYYSYEANPLVIPDFEGLADAGAVIVSGNQAHQPQALEFHNGALLHYGLGNLFFDQYYEGLPMRQAFIDRHVFYDNRYISTELLTIMFIDYARPRPMTDEERQDVLSTVFKASGWNKSTEELTYGN